MSPSDTPKPLTVSFGQQHLSCEDIVAISLSEATAEIFDGPDFRATIEAGPTTLQARLEAGDRIYGVNTGFGESCENVIPADLSDDLTLNLIRFHGCGTGRWLEVAESRAAVAARLASLVGGYSAVRIDVLEALAALLVAGISPRIPAEGSVGASGDLTPLSYIASALCGEREVIFRGNVVSAASALKECGLSALRLRPKEGLALMNGTSVMTGLACLAFDRAAKLSRVSAALTAMAVDVMRGEARHFDDRIFQAKPHPGQRAVARWIREDLESDTRRFPEPTRVQDRYSLRCAPHVIGVLVDCLPFTRGLIETELNGANDNPLLDPSTGDILHGGNFYGGHVCSAMDLLKTNVANLSDLLDRQMLLLCNPNTNNGLSENLVSTDAGVAHHGFKAMQILTSALAAESAKLSMPASVFSRSTENHNQDKVSMGTIAARDCLRMVELGETVAAAHLLALCQAFDLREGLGCQGRSKKLRDQVRENVPMNQADRRMDLDIQHTLGRLRRGELDFGVVDYSGKPSD